MDSTLEIMTVAWEDVRFIKLMEYFSATKGQTI